MIKKIAIVVGVSAIVFFLSFKIAYSSMVYTKAFPSLPKPPSSDAVKDAKGEKIIVYSILNNNKKDSVSKSYTQTLQQNGYAVTSEDQGILQANKNNHKYVITFTNGNKGTDITITKVE